MPKPRIALLVNLIAPARVALYERLASAFDFIVLHGEMEANRTSWRSVRISGASSRRIAGWQLSFNKHESGKVTDRWFLHLEPGYIWELVRERPDGVITDELGFRTLVALAYGTCFRKPVWVWWGGTRHTERHVGRFRKLMRRFVACWAKRWISYGQTSTEYLLSLGIHRERILEAQNCVDEIWYRVESEPALELYPKPVLLHVGQLIERKGISDFLRAAAQLQQEGRTFSILSVGGGRESAKLQQLVANLGLRDVHFYPAQPPHAMPGFYRSADVLIFPTKEDVWGLVANEAILSGLPVLCSCYAGCAQELFDPECIFNPSDQDQFVDALRRAVAGKLQCADMSRLKPSSGVGDIIANAVLAACAERRPTAPRDNPDPISRPAAENWRATATRKSR